ncbi:MAG: hypothetical protein ACFFKA_10705 [Candidatus Thorarchaeota archaeon]
MDCVASILDFYNNRIIEENVNSKMLSGVHLSNILIKVMKNFSEGKTDELELRNCLILLVNLFSDYDSPDHYNDKGKNVKEIVNEEKSKYIEILKEEFEKN